MKTLLPIIITFFTGATMAVDIHVRDDFDKGVESTVTLQYRDNQWDQGATDDNGFMTLDEHCKQGYKFLAYPRSPDFFSASVYCRPNDQQIVLKVTKRSYIVNMRNNAEFLESKGNLAGASLIYAELGARWAVADAQLAREYRRKATQYAVQSFDFVPTDRALVFDQQQNTQVISVEFSNELKKWQQGKGIPNTGQLDYLTLSELAGMHIGSSIKQTLH